MSEIPTTRINAYRAAVASTIQTAMPALKSCETQFGRFDIDALEKMIIRTPAVRFAVLNAGLMQEASNVDAALKCAAFVVTTGRKRDDAAWAIAEAIGVLLDPKQSFGLFKMSAPANIKIQPVISSAFKDRGVSVMAVEWSQELRALGEDIFDVEGVMREELYINDELVPDEPEAPDA